MKGTNLNGGDQFEIYINILNEHLHIKTYKDTIHRLCYTIKQTNTSSIVYKNIRSNYKHDKQRVYL